LFQEKRRQLTPPSDLFGIAQGRNVIIIMAESLHAFPIGLELDGQSVTPRLNAFAKESLYFANFTIRLIWERLPTASSRPYSRYIPWRLA
jgi:phosphoglycerol transferase MdoB-like AlkP superfamily enzyme